MNKAEIQLTKDVDVLMAILAGIPPSQIIFKTLACFPEASSFELQAIFCCSCLETGIVSQEDLADLSLLQKKTQVPKKTDPASKAKICSDLGKPFPETYQLPALFPSAL